MTIAGLTVYMLKFMIPTLFSVLFRAFGLGYKSKKRLIIGVFTFVVYMMVVPPFFIITMGYGEFTHISSIVMTIAAFSVLIFSTDTPGKTIFMQLAQGHMNTAISVILNLIRTVFALNYPMLVLMLLIVCPLVYFFALRVWAKPLRFILDNIHGELPVLISIPVLIMVIVYVIPVYPEQSFSHHPIYCTALMLAVELVFFLFIYALYRNLLKISCLLKGETARRRMETELLSYQESLEQTRQIRHDLHHHNALVLDYLQNGDTVGAIAYLRQNEETLTSAKLVRLSGNPTANAVFRIYNRQAQAEGIVFTIHGDFPEKMSLTAPEMGALLSNLLENAMEAVKKIKSGKRQIIFSAVTDEISLRLEVRNSMTGTVIFGGSLPQSSKPGGGTGTQSIAHIVQSHGGMFRFKQEDDEFAAQIILPL